MIDYYELATTDYISLDSLKNSYEAHGFQGVYGYFIENNLRKLGQPSNFYDFLLYADAQGYAYIGNKDKALQYLNIAIERRCNELYQIKYDPYFKNLRSDSSFLAILDKMNLGGYE